MIFFLPIDLTLFWFLKDSELPNKFNIVLERCCWEPFKSVFLVPLRERQFYSSPIKFLVCISYIMLFLILAFWTLFLMIILVILSFFVSFFANKFKMLYCIGFYGWPYHPINMINPLNMIGRASTWIQWSNWSIISECLLFQLPLIIVININWTLLGQFSQFFFIALY